MGKGGEREKEREMERERERERERARRLKVDSFKVVTGWFSHCHTKTKSVRPKPRLKITP